MDAENRVDSYRVAVTPAFSEDGHSYVDGRPKSRRKRPAPQGSHSAVTDELEEMRHGFEMDEHKVSLDTIYARYTTDPVMGLHDSQVKKAFNVFGPNKLNPLIHTPDWVIFCKNLFGGFSVILWVGCVLSLISFSVQSDLLPDPPYEELALGIILAAVVLLTGLFSYFQETNGTRVMDSLRQTGPKLATVIRDGRKGPIEVDNLVLGDIVEIKAGEVVPADIRIISARHFKVDNSILSGKLEPQARGPQLTHDNPLETMNLAFSTTTAVEGSCRGVVVATGERTLVGQLAMTAVEVFYPESTLIKEVTCTVHTLTAIGIIVGLFFSIVAFLAGFQWIDAIVFLVGIIVAIVPEGLLAVITISLILTGKRLCAKNCMVKNLDCIETVGGITAIVTDKSGVLTENRLTASHMWIDGKIVDVDNTPDQTGGSRHYISRPSVQALGRIAALCNLADNDPQTLNRDHQANPMDSALVKFVEKTLAPVSSIREKNRKVCEIPYSPAYRYQVTIHETDDTKDPSYILLMKGAPERLMECCSTILIGDREIAFTEKVKEALSEAFINVGSLGERVLGFCDYKLPSDKFPPGYPFDSDEENFPLVGLRFVGMMSFTDPIRPNVPDAVRKCQSAGVRVVLVTGDHPVTAKAVAKATGIFSEQSVTVEDIAAVRGVPVEEIGYSEVNSVVIHGAELKDMTLDRLHYFLRTHPDLIFARITPTQKLHIVEALQTQGNVVAVTGSLMNDAPALRKADIGIGMSAGDDIAKDSADIILLDNNFSTVICAIEEGRLIFDNLRKAVAYTLTSNMPEVWPFFIFLICGLPLPLGALTILVIDLGTDVFPAVSLTFEKPEYDIMKRKPRNARDNPLVDIQMIDVQNGQVGMIMAAAGFFSYCVILGENGFWMKDLLYRRRAWDSLGVSDFTDSYNQDWTYHQRKALEWTCHTAFFIAIVMCQLVHLICCKARRKMVFQHGFDNHVLTMAIVFTIGLAILLLYIPGMNIALRLYPIKINWWLTALPFCILVFAFDEVRRFLLFRQLEKANNF